MMLAIMEYWSQCMEFVVEHSTNIASISQRRRYSRHWRGGAVSCSSIVLPVNTYCVGNTVTVVSKSFEISKFILCLVFNLVFTASNRGSKFGFFIVIILEKYKVLVGKPEGKIPLRRSRCRWEDGIRMDLREVGWGGVDSSGSGQGLVGGPRECDDEPSGFSAMELVS
jgi:hypothetical protein